MKRLLAVLLGILSAAPLALAGPVRPNEPQIPLTGSIGVEGSAPVLGSSVITMSDADYTMTAGDYAANFIYLQTQSGAPLTAPRNLIGPSIQGEQFTIDNRTSGGFAVTITNGTGGVTIPNGQSMVVVFDGAMYIQGDGSSSSSTTLTGDVTGTGTGTVPTTLATVNSTPGTCGDATHVCQTTTNAKGLTTAQAAVAIAGGASLPANLSVVATNGSGAAVQAVGDTAYESVSSAPKGGSQGSMQIIANAVVDANVSNFTGTGPYAGDQYHCAGPAYCSEGVYAEDFTYTALFNPSKIGATELQNVANVFMANTTTGGQIYPAINQTANGAGLSYSGFDAQHAYVSGVAMYMVPLMDYLYYQKTGSTSQYTAHVAALKTAWAYSPLNTTSGCPQSVVGTSEWVPASLFLEEPRFTGDVASACVLRSAAAVAMNKMATAAGDSTNVTYFNNIASTTSASVQSEFVDATSHMLFGATGQDKQIDVLTSGMAVWFSQFLNYPILTPAQQTAIGTFLHTNLSAMTYNGYFANTVTSAGAVTTWTTQGIIPAGGGGSGYTADGCAAGDYQAGYWSLATGMAATALDLSGNSADVPTLLASFRDAATGSSLDPAWEYYTQAGAHGTSCTNIPANATTPNMESPQSAAWAAANIVGPTPVVAGGGNTDKYGAVVTSGFSNPYTVTSPPQVFQGNLSGNNLISVQNNNTVGFSAINYNDTSGSPKASTGFANTGIAGGLSGHSYWYSVAVPFCLTTSGQCTEGLNMDLSGNVTLNENLAVKANTTSANYLATGTGTPWPVTAFNGTYDANNGGADSPGFRGYYAANLNMGFNVSNLGVPTTCTTAEAIRFINDFGETGGAVNGAIDRAGNLCGWNGLRMTAAGLLGWNGDTGLTRTAAGIVALGNGTAGNDSGTLKASNVLLDTAGSTSTVPAQVGFSFTGGSEYGSFNFGNCGMQSGFADGMGVFCYWGIHLGGNRQTTPPAFFAGTTSDASLTINGTTGDSADILDLTNFAGTKLASFDKSGNELLGTASVATSTANFSSASLTLSASYWNGTAAAADTWSWQNVLGTGANPTSTLTLLHSGSTGGQVISMPGYTYLSWNSALGFSYSNGLAPLHGLTGLWLGSSAGQIDGYLSLSSLYAGGTIYASKLSGSNNLGGSNFVGTCTMSSATTCSVTLPQTYTTLPQCFITEQGSAPVAAACAMSGTNNNVATVTAASANSATWNVMLIGN